MCNSIILSTSGSDPDDPGSSPGSTFLIVCGYAAAVRSYGDVAQIQHGVPTYLQQPCNVEAHEERRNGGIPTREHLQQINTTVNWPNVSKAFTKRSIHWSTRFGKSTHTTSGTRPSTQPCQKPQGYNDSVPSHP
jgi:hypothetical protein